MKTSLLTCPDFLLSQINIFAGGELPAGAIRKVERHLVSLQIDGGLQKPA